MDDFRTNGLLLPSLPSLSERSGLPLHLGGHRNYNEQIILELRIIRQFCESIRVDSNRRSFALAAVRGLQQRARQAILCQRSGHIDRVSLQGQTDSDIDALIDRLFAARPN
jgi:A nuclease family of the HNH/ENDO VII superfamily with conserved AHH